MGGFENFSITHWVMLAIFAGGVWPVVRLGCAHRGTPAARTFSRWFALAIPAFTIPMQVVDFLPGQYDFDTTLPLQLCDFAWITAVVALWTHSRFAAAVTYFWGLVLTSQALITPWLNADVPSPKFLGYWGMHWLIVWAAIYLAWGLRLTPGWRVYAGTVGADDLALERQSAWFGSQALVATASIFQPLIATMSASSAPTSSGDQCAATAS